VESSGSLRSLGAIFDQVAEAYDEARRGYPPGLVDVAIERGRLAGGSRVLEVGCGTAKLTESLVARGLLVDAVDPGPNMVAAARRRLGATDAVTFHIARFEDVSLPKEAFDAAFSATAFHWVDPDVGWTKAASHLKPRGLLALLTHVGVLDKDSRGFEDEFLAVLTKHAPGVSEEWRLPHELDTILAGAHARRDNASEVWDWLMGDGRHNLAVPEAASLFDDVEVASEVASIEESADQLLALLRTTSLYFRIEPARREAFEEDERRVVERIGGTVHTSLATVLMTARRTGT
jgi:ubiquinone/menaquinone biosynthesis C-methylase UbiE